jgi:photosystem II stability/assembly factor-like uncharacterized protein
MRVALAALLATVSTLFSGTPIIRSTDGGRTWTDIDPGLPHQGVVDLQVAPNGSRLYALTVTGARSGPLYPALARRDYSVLSSSDGGRTWQELEPLRVPNVWLATMAMAPSDPETLYVAYGRTHSETGDLAREHAILSTMDGGRTAVELRSADDVLLRQSGTQFGLCSQFIYLPQVATAFLAVHPAISTRLFWGLECAVEYDGIHPGFIASADGGITWQLSWKVGLKQLLAHTDDPATLYAKHQETYHRARGHLARSSDGGNEWSIRLSDVLSFALNPHDPSVLLASKEDGSVWRSSDRAETWEQLGNWLPLDRLIFHPAKPSVVLAQAAEHEGDIFRSEDGGATWTVLPTGMDGFSFVFDPSHADTIYGISAKRRDALFSGAVRTESGREVDALRDP